MKLSKALLYTTFLWGLIPLPKLMSLGQQVVSPVPTFRSTSTLVFLDVTVLDESGRPVVTGLSKDDFTITEEKQPQRIFSFEAPQVHVMSANAGDANPEGKAPVTIFVLDLLNSSFEDFAYIRYSVQKYLDTQPAHLSSPAEMMVISNDSLELLQGYTRSKADLLFALKHVPAALPYKKMNESFWAERFGQSIDALQQIALQNQGVPGRKNIVWVGRGGPGLYTAPLISPVIEDVNRYVHETANMLVDARISLFVIYPGLKVGGTAFPFSAMEADADIGNGDDDPFSGDVNFGVFVNETGGELFFDQNDVDNEIRHSQELGSEYYTLTYQPHDVPSNGKFRRIRVTLRDRNLHVVTKTGYFAPDVDGTGDPRQKRVVDVFEAARATIPFEELDLKVKRVERDPNTRSAQLDLQLNPKNLEWHREDDGNSTVGLVLAAVSLAKDGGVLASKLENITLTANTQDMTRLSNEGSPLQLKIRVPRNTANVRVALEADSGGRIGALEVSRKTIDAAPVRAAPESEPISRKADPTHSMVPVAH